ncbi:S46 family peptidase [bacterium]|nr:S46 family peptidase [bacterium]
MSLFSDEGMWLFNDPPFALLSQRHNFTLTNPWLENACLSSVRFNNGGSGGFVSADGLIITNHHIGADSLQKLSTPTRDLLRDGFIAKNQADELPCPDLELNVLTGIEDVTEKVKAAVTSEMKPAEAFAARRSAMAAIEKESADRTGLRSDIVTLYQGGLYHLYRYKKYTEVKLVLAPESAIASFGGDVDNFEFPRHSLDFCLFRAYENGKPAKPAKFFKLAKNGPAEGDLVFVTGHPGTTNRLETLAKLIHRRDYFLPYSLARLRTYEAALIQFSASSPANSAIATTDLHRVANARKAFTGQYNGLLNPSIIQAKSLQENNILKAAEQEPEKDSPWKSIADVQKKLALFETDYLLFERGDAFFSELFTIARHIVRMADELPLTSGKRLREYRDSNLDSLKFQLYSPAPIHSSLEQAKLATSLSFMAEKLGGAHPLVKIALADEPPSNRAASLVNGSKLFNPDERRKLVDGGKQAVLASNDPLIVLARAIDAKSRELRQRYEEEVEEPERQAYSDIARIRFKALGKNVAPDATFTLRLAFGIARGYQLDDKEIPFQTTYKSLFDRHNLMQGKLPFDLPERWLKNRDKLNLSTPLNFASTADTIGGNSGSPVLNREGELIGVNFDRNRHGLVRNFVYTDVQARHIAVHTQGILESLRTIYQANDLIRELTSR